MLHSSPHTVSALFVRKDSIYKQLNVDCWDFERDARKWPGGNPVIAHPPCRAWGKYKGFAKPRQGEKELAIWAINVIRKYGGVLEHPSGSSLWKEMKLPLGSQVDEFGGYTISVDQKWWGHLAKKKTLLYIVGCSRKALPLIPISFDAITHCVGHNKGARHKKRGKEITKSQREETPVAFAKWLINVAELSNPRPAH